MIHFHGAAWIPEQSVADLQTHAVSTVVNLGAGRVEDNLRDAVAVAQVDEYQRAVVAAAVHPARETHVLPRMSTAERARSQCPICRRSIRRHALSSYVACARCAMR